MSVCVCACVWRRILSHLLSAAGTQDQSCFSENVADSFGGAVLVPAGSSFTVSASHFSHNEATVGGSLYVQGAVDVNVCFL